MILIDGKKIAEESQRALAARIAKIQGRAPSLTFILVGDNSASQSYVRAKKKACSVVGITSDVLTFSAQISESDLIKQISALNKNPEVDGILVQLPLPTHISSDVVLSFIAPTKDVDGFHPLNMGKTLLGLDDGFRPCTPLAICRLLKDIDVEGKHVVILGRSNIVGKPLAAMLMQKKSGCNATVTIAHSRSKHLTEIARSAEILIAAVGIPRFVTKEMVRPNAVVIDVGINRTAEGKLTGDVAFDEVSPLCSHITPVPGGVGPMTVQMLLENTLKSRLL